MFNIFPKKSNITFAIEKNSSFSFPYKYKGAHKMKKKTANLKFIREMSLQHEKSPKIWQPKFHQ